MERRGTGQILNIKRSKRMRTKGISSGLAIMKSLAPHHKSQVVKAES